MLAAGRSLDVCNSNGEYLIHLACRRSRPETVRWLLESGGVRADVRSAGTDDSARRVLEVATRCTDDGHGVTIGTAGITFGP